MIAGAYAVAGRYSQAFPAEDLLPDLELHQVTASPETAPELLDRLLKTTTNFSKDTDEALRFGEFVGRSWLSIARSKGVPI